MNRVRWSWVAACLVSAAQAAAAGSTQVSYADGLMSIECNGASLVQVFERIRAVTGMELILDDTVKTKRLSAHVEAQPVHRAIERLLEGSGVNYALSFDPQDWRRVTKVFIGSGGESPAAPPRRTRSRTPIRRQPIRRAPPPADPDQEEEMLDELEEDMPTEEELEEPGETETPQEATPSQPGYLQPAPSYPRSSFTPGLESSPFRQKPATEPSEGAEEGKPAPPAYYPFPDAFGRPIPVPRDQRQQKKKPKENR